MGIRHIGQENAKIIAGYFKSIDKFKKFFNSNKKNEILRDLLELDGIGDTQINSLNSFFSNKINLKITQNLIKELNISNFQTQLKKGVFSNKKIMFTGGFKTMSRSEAKSIAENKGGKVLGSISKKLDFLVVGDSKPTKKKINQAKTLKIRIILEEEKKKMSFENLTMAPIEKDLIDYEELNDSEKEWLNNYHKTVFKNLKKSMNSIETLELKRACSAI